MTQAISLFSRCQVTLRYTQKCFGTQQAASHQRELRLLGETQRTNVFKLAMEVALEGLR